MLQAIEKIESVKKHMDDDSDAFRKIYMVRQSPARAPQLLAPLPKWCLQGSAVGGKRGTTDAAQVAP